MKSASQIKPEGERYVGRVQHGEAPNRRILPLRRVRPRASSRFSRVRDFAVHELIFEMVMALNAADLGDPIAG